MSKLMFDSHPRSKFWSERNTIHPSEVCLGSHKKYEFKCEACFHYFLSAPHCIIQKNSWCSYCTNKKLCDEDNCKICYEKSFASYGKSKWWSSKNVLTPRQVFRGTNKKYIFDCNNCYHEFFTSPGAITTRGRKANWCPYCASQKLCENLECHPCFEKSFASHPQSKYWSPKNSLTPRFVFFRSGKNYLFICEKCNHEYASMLSNRSLIKDNCIFCANQKLCNQGDCEICYKKSFASHPQSKYWSGKNNCLPRSVFKNSHSKYLFDCAECKKEFRMVISGVTKKIPEWCPLCINKTENKMKKWLMNIYPNTVHQYKPAWCISPNTKKQLSFDFYIPDINIIIEIDGDQHFRQVLNWESHISVQSRDLYKTKMAYDQKISIIRIPFKNIFVESKFIDYEKKLINHLNKKQVPEIVYLCENIEIYNYMTSYDFNGNAIPEVIPAIKFNSINP